MFTVLIPVLKKGYLEAQLRFLKKQTYTDFIVIAMDVHYSSNKHKAFAVANKYPFKFIHLPLIHNIDMPKYADYSIKNNLALLTNTDKFVFLSDTHLPLPTFAKSVRQLAVNYDASTFIKVGALPAKYYNSADFSWNVPENYIAEVAPPIMFFDKKEFFYILEGFDESTTYPFCKETMLQRMAKCCSVRDTSIQAVHINHSPNINSFGKHWKEPCLKCQELFPHWRFVTAWKDGVYPIFKLDVRTVNAMSWRDPYTGAQMFKCRECGFGGALEAAKMERFYSKGNHLEAPNQFSDNLFGRNIMLMHEYMPQDHSLQEIPTLMAMLKLSYK